MSGASLPLKRRVDILGQLTVRARCYLDIFEFLEDPSTQPHIIDQINDYVWFLRLQQHVYRFAFIVEIAGLYKRKRGTVNYWHLLDELAPRLGEAEAARLTGVLEEAEPIAKKTELIRNKALAHRSSDIDFDDVFRQADVTRQQLKGLTDAGLDVSNALLKSLNLSEVNFLTKEIDRDGRRLFRKLGSAIPLGERTFIEQLLDRDD